MWVTVEELVDHLPIHVHDANGMLIDEAITGFDPETGEVESCICRPDGSIVVHPTHGALTMRAMYPAPLLWKRVSAELSARTRQGWRG